MRSTEQVVCYSLKLCSDPMGWEVVLIELVLFTFRTVDG